ncbi:MAG: hypothetical protein KFB95_06920 [Simkaniaceae bacterium]|nr:MAG: hypothetical protein KFB95_06920 [Simkaniaceae bacterium]
MNKTTIVNIAKQYLESKNIDFLEPGKLGRLEGHKQEVVFLDPQALDPNVAVVEPGDIRVWVNVNTKQAALLEQM